MFEDLYSQGLFDNEIEMNKIEEEMMIILKRVFTDEDEEDVMNSKKWK